VTNVGGKAERFEDQVARTWSSHFGCAPEDLDRTGTTLVRDPVPSIWRTSAPGPSLRSIRPCKAS
jgi:hypothetical protein